MRILVLDGEHRSALAALRSLGRNGLEVYTGSEFANTISGYSKYCKKAFTYRSPCYYKTEFINDLKDIISKNDIGMIYPMTDASMYRVLQHEEELRKKVQIPAVSFEKYLSASNKSQLIRMASKRGISCPDSKHYENYEQALDKSNTFEYPLVLKPQFSIIERNNQLVHCGVILIDSPLKLEKVLKERPYFQFPFMVQNVIKGEGLGVFVLCQNGCIRAYSGHRRIREKPPTGGVSVVSESTVPEKALMAKIEELLKDLQWSGVAMIEFKNDEKTNTPKIMEINARFWGSLQLSIDAGVDFPFLLYSLYTDNKLTGTICDINKVRLRWLTGDFDNLIINLKRGDTKTKLQSLLFFCYEFMSGAKIEDFRYNDFRPFFHQLQQYTIIKN